MQTENLISGKELSELLDVSAPAVSMAVRDSNHCKGYDISKYAVFENGRVQGFKPEIKDLINARENPGETVRDKNPGETVRKKKTDEKSKESSLNRSIQLEDKSVRFLDDEGAKSVGKAYMGSVAIQAVPKAIDSIKTLKTHQQDALLSSLIAGGFTLLGYFIGKKNPVMALGFGVFGYAIYGLSKTLDQRALSEDRAMVGTNPSAVQRTGDIAPVANIGERATSFIHEMKPTLTPVKNAKNP